jgi:hypothetical protein
VVVAAAAVVMAVVATAVVLPAHRRLIDTLHGVLGYGK